MLKHLLVIKPCFVSRESVTKYIKRECYEVCKWGDWNFRIAYRILNYNFIIVK